VTKNTRNSFRTGWSER